MFTTGRGLYRAFAMATSKVCFCQSQGLSDLLMSCAVSAHATACELLSIFHYDRVSVTTQILGSQTGMVI